MEMMKKKEINSIQFVMRKPCFPKTSIGIFYQTIRKNGMDFKREKMFRHIA